MACTICSCSVCVGTNARLEACAGHVRPHAGDDLVVDAVAALALSSRQPSKVALVILNLFQPPGDVSLRKHLCIFKPKAEHQSRSLCSEDVNKFESGYSFCIWFLQCIS